MFSSRSYLAVISHRHAEQLGKNGAILRFLGYSWGNVSQAEKKACESCQMVGFQGFPGENQPSSSDRPHVAA
jgi:hypothetical protein